MGHSNFQKTPKYQNLIIIGHQIFEADASHASSSCNESVTGQDNQNVHTTECPGSSHSSKPEEMNVGSDACTSITDIADIITESGTLLDDSYDFLAQKILTEEDVNDILNGDESCEQDEQIVNSSPSEGPDLNNNDIVSSNNANDSIEPKYV